MALGVLQHLQETEKKRSQSRKLEVDHEVRRELRGSTAKERRRGSTSVKYCIGLVR